MNYYYLIAGLPDLQLDNQKGVPALENLKEELKEALSEVDIKLLELLLMSYDNRNLLLYLSKKEVELNHLACLSREDWKELVELMEEKELPQDARLAPYILEYYRTINDEKAASEIASKEDFLASLYYDFGTTCKNEFVAQWFEFNLNLNNLLAAIACRKHGFDVKTAIVGNNEVAHILRATNARDFGVTGLIDDVERIFAIAEEPNLLEREKRTDALKWAWLEEHTFFSYFGIERVLAFWLRCELLNRWSGLSVEQGKEIFRNLLQDLKQGVKF